MSNSFFRFKQFVIHQDRCAMKITTDSCVFGAWVANKCVGQNGLQKVLDIGSGTGLLSLLYAQQNPGALIDGVELDASSAAQSAENIKASPWNTSIKIHQQNIIGFNPGYPYDIIISNPPFYENQLKSNDVKRIAAHHSSHLSLIELFEQADRLIKPGGYFFVMLPYYRATEAIESASRFNFSPLERLNVRQSFAHDFFRVLLIFCRNNLANCKQTEFTIEQTRGQYTEAFTALLKDYYLKL